MRHFFRHDSLGTFLLISLVIHLLFFCSWPGRQRTGAFSPAQIPVELLSRQPRGRRPAARSRPVPRKKAAVSKKKRLKPVPRTKTRPAIKKARTSKRQAVKKSALAAIKKRYARAEQRKELDKIRQKLAEEKQQEAGAPAAGQARVMLYAEQLKAWITRHWNLPEMLAREKLSATVSLTIDAAGNLLEQKIERLSGNQLFDDSILLAIKRAAPFPPFPPVMHQEREEFVITFEPRDVADQ